VGDRISSSNISSVLASRARQQVMLPLLVGEILGQQGEGFSGDGIGCHADETKQRQGQRPTLTTGGPPKVNASSSLAALISAPSPGRPHRDGRDAYGIRRARPVSAGTWATPREPVTCSVSTPMRPRSPALQGGEGFESLRRHPSRTLLEPAFSLFTARIAV
jgi:hypothetical protein